MTALVMTAVAWGALSFGAVYPWAYWPLLAACLVSGMVGLVRAGGRPNLNRPLALGFGAVAAAVLVQLIPLPRAVLPRISPAADAFLRQYDLSYALLASGAVSFPAASGPGAREPVTLTHALSISPPATWLGLTFLLVFGVFLLGAVRGLTRRGVERLGRALPLLGSLLALVGIVQKATFSGKIYGFWQPEYPLSSPFGPFVNRNHFAGWMLMALPLTIGFFCERVGEGMRGAGPGLRNRVLWFSSREASQVVLLGGAIFLMAVALMMTLSRSGIASFAVAVALTAAFLGLRQANRARGAVAAACLACLVLGALGWTGADRLSRRFTAEKGARLEDRMAVWGDALAIARDFPVTGSGLNTFSTAMLVYQTTGLDGHYAEAHNDYLQLVAEGGVLVAVPAAVLVLLFVREVRRAFREERGRPGYWIRAGAVSGLVAIGLQELVDFSLQMPGNATLFVVLCAIALRRWDGARGSEPHRASRIGE